MRLQRPRDRVFVLSWTAAWSSLAASISPRRTAVCYLLPPARDRMCVLVEEIDFVMRTSLVARKQISLPISMRESLENSISALPNVPRPHVRI